MASYKLVTAPATEPITLTEAKLYLRVDDTTEDNLITALIVAARMQVEKRTYRPLITQTWELILNSNEVLEDSKIYLNKAPLTSITSVKYYDTNNTEQTLSSSFYQTSLNGNPAELVVTSLPQIYERLDAVTIRFVAGYANAAAVPQDIKQAMYFIIGHLYENRQQVVTGTQVNEMPLSAEYLLEPYRNLVYGF